MPPATVVPIKVNIGLRPNGHADHPDWTRLPLAGSGNKQEREAQVTTHSLGSWHYDQLAGHEEDAPDSPIGMQWGMRFVSPQFASEAETMFPALVTRMTRAECADFWDNRARLKQVDEDQDIEILQGLQARRALMVLTFASAVMLDQLNVRIAKALDPDDDEPGVRKNTMRRFANARSKLGVIFDASVPP